MIMKGSLDMEVLAAFILYIKMITSPITKIIHTIGNIPPAIACADRIFEYMDLEEEIDDGQVKPENIKGAVEFKHVHFGYVEGQTILKDFSASVQPGMKVAIVGPTGAGKSTLINLLMRFYEIGSGDILIDGISIKEMSRKDLHNIFSMVLQETWTFEGSIRENIAYSTENVENQDIEHVLEESGLKFMVSQLPDGVDTTLSENSSVSAGQKQLITIARAMLKRAQIMILDEATSSVDTRTEKLIQSAIDKMTKGHTSFVIAHRLSTIKNADIIFVLKDGDIIETGNHKELLAKGGFYSELYRTGMEEA
jgi:ATP-binding cassette subfamily B protein